MKSEKVTLDSGILQFVPKGAFYESQNEQFNQVSKMWNYLFNFDRTLFCLITLLKGTGFSKGAMAHMLLENSQPTTNLPATQGLSFDYETKVILYNLYNEAVPRALKNLLMLTGNEGFKKINNARTRKIILEYIFKRDNRELDSLAINFKGKLRTLVRHAIGKQYVARILSGDQKLFNKWIGRYNRNAYPVVLHLFDKEIDYTVNKVSAYFPMIEKYGKLKEAAKNDNEDLFRQLMVGMPQRTVMGFRNTYKLTIDKSEIYETAKVSEKESIQLETAAKKSGAKTYKVNYKNNELYDLWKALYNKIATNDSTNIKEIQEAIEFQSDKQHKVDIGNCVVVIDASKSMSGSSARPLHPFFTSLCLISTLTEIQDVIYVGGAPVQVPGTTDSVIIPANATPLWKGLVEAAKSGNKNIIIVSDGYENEVKGMFKHTYNYIKNKQKDINVIHINPVFAADAKQGSVRKLADDIEPMPIADYKFLETEIIFKQMISNKEVIKKLLLNKYKQLIDK